MNDIEEAIKTILDIYSEYLTSDTDTVNLRPYDEALQEVHTVLEQALQEKAKGIPVETNHFCGHFDRVEATL